MQILIILVFFVSLVERIHNDVPPTFQLGIRNCRERVKELVHLSPHFVFKIVLNSLVEVQEVLSQTLRLHSEQENPKQITTGKLLTYCGLIRQLELSLA